MIYRMNVKTAMNGLRHWGSLIRATNDKQGFFLNEEAAKNLENFLFEVECMFGDPTTDVISEMLATAEEKQKNRAVAKKIRGLIK